MCTVSFIPVRDNIIITSNRDEKVTRKEASRPGVSFYKGQKLLYPRDGDAGGTWIVLKQNGDAGVLLNGAFICHAPELPYRMSRGVVLLDIVSTTRPSIAFTKINLQDIEPFTLVLLESNCLYEFRWDGSEKYCRQLSTNRAHIWSSATLYDGFAVKKREQWFASFLNSHPVLTQQDIMNFHRFTGDGDKKNDLLMTRDSVYKTVSITSIFRTRDRGNMKYLDLSNNRLSEVNIALTASTALK
ncbi:MAG TPA: NRDE family protein [Chitinophagaceae bacterium]|nr:NRDE family protein [Chitinophagaceae bacterium]